MIIIHGGLAYPVTRDSAEGELSDVLAKVLENTGKYNRELRDSMLDEILENTEFPAILDEPIIFVYDEASKSFTGYRLDEKPVKDKNAFSIKNFAPKCKGTTLVKEAKAIFQKYSLKHLMGSNENGFKHPIVYLYNDECLVGKMENPVQVLTKAFKDIVGIENAENVANTVSDKMFAGTTIFVEFVNTDTETVTYALRSDGSVRKSTPFSVDSIYKAIMSELPKMKCTSEKAKTAAIYAHNKILYDIGLTDFAIVSPVDFTKEGKPIFERKFGDITFWITPDMRNWRSKDMFSEAIGKIAWRNYRSHSHEDSTACSRDYTSASYMGFSILPATYEEAKPFFKAGINVLCYSNLFEDTIRTSSWTVYYGNIHNRRERVPVYDQNGYKSSLGYFGDIESVTDVLHFKLAARAAIMD